MNNYYDDPTIIDILASIMILNAEVFLSLWIKIIDDYIEVSFLRKFDEKEEWACDKVDLY